MNRIKAPRLGWEISPHSENLQNSIRDVSNNHPHLGSIFLVKAGDIAIFCPKRPFRFMRHKSVALVNIGRKPGAGKLGFDIHRGSYIYATAAAAVIIAVAIAAGNRLCGSLGSRL